jgi:hypothetical protein
MTRMTNAGLESIAGRINRIQRTPATPYVRGLDGNLKAQIGCYFIDYAYGGVQLCQMVNDGGGVTDVLYSGHIPKRELADRMYAFIYGLSKEETK